MSEKTFLFCLICLASFIVGLISFEEKNETKINFDYCYQLKLTKTQGKLKELIINGDNIKYRLEFPFNGETKYSMTYDHEELEECK